MRAIFDRNISGEVGSHYEVSGDSKHHLQVIRLKVSEPVAIFNGNGVRYVGETLKAHKDEIILKIIDIQVSQRRVKYHLFLGVPKKDHFEDCLRSMIESGYESLIPLSCQFSQYQCETNSRLEKIIESSIIQSNNPFYPRIHNQVAIPKLSQEHSSLLQSLDGIFLMSLHGKNNPEVLKNISQKYQKQECVHIGVFIGPEGGFSPNEEFEILNLKSTLSVGLQFNSPILKSSTAVSYSMGFIEGLSSAK